MTALRWGFLGAGWIAQRALAPAVHAADGAVLHAVASRDLGRARALSPAIAYTRYDELLADSDVDAVYICLNNDAHRPWTLAALVAGKHVLCEKPLGLDADEVDAMVTAAQRADRLLVEASWYRWHPRVRRAESLLAQGAVGTVRHVAAGFTFTGRAESNYRLEVSRGGGALLDVGCYAVSAAMWAFGGAAVRTVSARSRYGASGVDLTTEAVVAFDTGTAELRASFEEPERQWLTVTGDAGELDLPGPSFAAWTSDDTELVVSGSPSSGRHAVPAVDAYRLMVEDVSARVRGNSGYLVPLAESRGVARVLDACRASARAGGEAVVPAP